MTYTEALTELAELLPESWNARIVMLLQWGDEPVFRCTPVDDTLTIDPHGGDNEHDHLAVAMALVKLMSGARIERQYDGTWGTFGFVDDIWLFEYGESITEAVARLAVKVLRARKEEANGLG